VALILLDASVVAAHLDAADPAHAAATAALREHVGDDCRIPASAYAELLVDAARAGRLEEARRTVGRLGLTVTPIDGPIAEQAALWRGRSPALRLPEALVIATAEHLAADAVLTTDRRWRHFARVEVIGAA
jgi:predicted nucleic acid-binding protein